MRSTIKLVKDFVILSLPLALCLTPTTSHLTAMFQIHCMKKVLKNISTIKFSLTFWIIVSEKLDVILLGEGRQVWRHHTAGGQVDLVTTGLHLVQHQEWVRSVSGGLIL